MSGSPYERYRAELIRLHDEFRPVYARFLPDAEPFAVLTLERDGRMILVECFADGRVESDVADTLPGLRAVLAAGAEIVRYHPRRRCTVRAGERFGKVLADGSGPALFAAKRELWAHRDELGFAVAEPLSYDDETRTLWLAAVPGEDARPRLAGTDGAALAGRMGAALATLAASGVNASAAPARSAADELVRRVPELRDDVSRLLEEIARLHAAAPPRRPRPVHGAPHPPQWLVDGEHLGLIDFDRLALGDPEADVAAFVEAAAAEDGGEAIAAAFLAGYGPLDEQRLTAYRHERRIARALRAASALRPDGAERAVRRLREGALGPRRARTEGKNAYG